MNAPAEEYSASDITGLFDQYVVPNYVRQRVIVRGEGSQVWDADGKRYLDLGGGIAVSSLGHGHPRLTKALSEQAASLIHTSNLYYTEPQGRLAKRLVELTGPGKVFFCNSGAEANEALMKMARLHGSSGPPQRRYEILTAMGSFHGRTMAGISATGQEKVKQGFGPLLEGFQHLPYNNLAAFEEAISDKTVAIMIEGIQGESGIVPADVEFLIGLRKLTKKRNILLLWDGIQCGLFRTGNFHSYQTILGDDLGDFLPDGISMAKSLGGGFPIGAVWMHESVADTLQPGTHGTTFGGTPLACSAAHAVLDEVEQAHLVDNIRERGQQLLEGLIKLGAQGKPFAELRGVGAMIGVVLKEELPALDAVVKLADAGLLVVPAGGNVIRFLPPLNITSEVIEETLSILEKEL